MRARHSRACPATWLFLAASVVMTTRPAIAQEADAESIRADPEATHEELRHELDNTRAAVDSLTEELADVERRAAATASVIAGREVYRQFCRTCHGDRGDGRGPTAKFITVQPRDFTSARFKFRMTPSGELPTDDDLFRTISKGIPGTQMPRWEVRLTEAQRRAVVQYIKSFSPAFEEEGPGDPIEINDRSDLSSIDSPAVLNLAIQEAVARGAAIYEKMKCGECHGAKGRGDGPAAATLLDEKGRPIWPYDFTSGKYRGGSSARDVYRTMSTGLAGTPMPGYADLLTQEERWDLVQYVQSLVRPRSWFFSILFDDPYLTD